MANVMHQREDLVTIITPVYNGEATIARTIESVLNQTYKHIEYIVIDGASKDETLDVVKRYEKQFQNGKSITIISEPDNGMYEALNKGIRMSHGFLIGNINADDWYEPSAVEEMVNLYRHNEYDIAWADLMIHGKRKTFVKKAKVGFFWTTAHFCHPTLFCKREALFRYPYLEQNMDDDYDMILRANKGGAKIITMNKILAHYMLGGMSTEKGFERMMNRVVMKYRTYVRNGYSRFYFLYCLMAEFTKAILLKQ